MAMADQPIELTEYRGKLYQSAYGRQGPRLPQILMPHHRLRDALGLRLWGSLPAQQAERDHAAIELKRHQRRRYVPVRCADVVQQAREEISLGQRRAEPGWEGGAGYGDAWWGRERECQELCVEWGVVGCSLAGDVFWE